MDQFAFFYTTGKNYEVSCISAIFCIFVVHEGCFFVWNTFLRADISFWRANSQLTAKWTAKFAEKDVGIRLGMPQGDVHKILSRCKQPIFHTE